MKWTILFLSLCACASSKKCPDAVNEPVSVCRAETARGRGTISRAISLVFGGMGSGMSGQRNHAQDNYEACIERNISSQRANAGLPDNTLRCETTKISDDTFRTKCN